jgi:hypothetical protein
MIRCERNFDWASRQYKTTTMRDSESKTAYGVATYDYNNKMWNKGVVTS